MIFLTPLSELKSSVFEKIFRKQFLMNTGFPRMKDISNSLVFVVALLAAFEQFAVGQGKFATVNNLQTQLCP